jgi:hypothetical protein
VHRSNSLHHLGIDQSIQEIGSNIRPVAVPPASRVIRAQRRESGHNVPAAVKEKRNSPSCAQCAATVASVLLASLPRSVAAWQAANSRRARNNGCGWFLSRQPINPFLDPPAGKFSTHWVVLGDEQPDGRGLLKLHGDLVRSHPPAGCAPHKTSPGAHRIQETEKVAGGFSPPSPVAGSATGSAQPWRPRRAFR